MRGRHSICILFLAGANLLLAVQPSSACTTITQTTITTDTVWGPSGSPADTCYTIQNSITISGSATLTIQAGTVVRFAAGRSLTIGLGSPGSLQAIGTGSSPVVFTSTADSGPGGWGGLIFQSESDVAGAFSVLSDCVIRRGGSGGQQIQIASSNAVTLTNCLISEHSGYGLNLSNAVANANGCVFKDFGSYPAYGFIRDVGLLFVNNQFVPNASGARNAILLRLETLTQTTALSTPDPQFCYITEPGDYDIGLEPNDPVLTIATNTVIKMANGSRFLTGNGGANGGLIAKGVVFTSVADDTLGDTDNGGPSIGAPGQWEGILFEGATIDASTSLDSCVVRFAGQSNSVGIRINGCEPIVTRCVITRNSVYGLRVLDAAVTAGGVTNNLLRDNGTYEISAVPRAMESLVPNNHVVPSLDGRYNGYEVVAGTVTQHSTMPSPPVGFCYITEAADINIGLEPNDPILTIGLNTVVKMRSGSRILTGSGGANGGLIAKGVVFTSATDDTISDTDGGGSSTGAPGQWEGILLESATIDASTSLDSCVIRFAGQSNSVGVRLTSCEPAITRCVIRNNSGYGLRVIGATTTAGGVTGNLLRDNGTYEISAVPRAMEHLVPNNQVLPSLDERYNGYELVAGTVTASSLLPTPPAGFCYISENDDIDIGLEPNDPVVTIAPHTVIKMRSASRLLTGNGGANGGLIAKGVVFTSALDDTLGDTDGNGVSTGAPGQWEGILFESATIDDYAVISCSTVRFAGAGGINAGIRVTNSRPSIAHSVITRNNLRGIAVIGSEGKVDLFGSLISNNGTGVEASSNAVPYLERCSIVGNATAGLTNQSASVTVQATSCWWGSATGPTNASNPGGTGQVVSGTVAFTPWLTTEPARPCDLTVGVDLSSVAYDATPDRIEITWTVPAMVGQTIRILRSPDRTTWQPVGNRTVPSDGRVRFVDVNLTPASTYVYRLTVGDQVVTEIAIETPAALALAIQAPKPNPTRLPLHFQFTLPDRSPVSVELIDLAGRRLFQGQLNGLDPGSHSFEIPGSPAIHSGVYYLRVASNGRIASAPIVIMR